MFLAIHEICGAGRFASEDVAKCPGNVSLQLIGETGSPSWLCPHCRHIAGITIHPNEAWVKQIARNATMGDCGALRDRRYLLHDRDTKFTRSFRAILISDGVEPLALPARSPNLNAYAERWVR